MKCPSCHFEQAEDRLDCEYCGLIFAKWRARHSPPPAQEGPVEPASPTASALPNGEALVPEPGIPDHPENVTPLYGLRPRLYQQVAALDFQKDLDGNWIYFPWGVFGKGYRLKNSELKNDIEVSLTRFCSIHSPLAATLGLVAVTNWFYNVLNPTQGFVFLATYLPLAYLFLWIMTRQWTAQKPASANRLNQKQYYFLFFKIFNWRILFDLEVAALFLMLTCVWMLVSEKWRWFLPEENFSVMWMWFAFSGSILALFSYLYYFRKK